MPNLQNYPVYQQAVANSCWACAARSVLNYNFGHQALPIKSDQDLANDWAAVTRNPNHANINVQQSASAALGDLGIVNNTDNAPLPTLAEINDQIAVNRPMLAIIGATNPHGTPNLAYQGGHWLVIVGADTAANTISVFDPQTGAIATVAYDSATYGGYPAGNFWQNTSHLGPA